VLRALAAGAAATCLLLGGGSAVAGVAVGAADTLGGWVKPLDGARVSQGFGCTSVPNEVLDLACPGRHWHSGIDLVAAAGTPVHAPLAGVARVVRSAWGYGLHVILDHGDGLATLFGHLSAVEVSSGQAVSAGTVIGAVGSTGNSTGPHLHFEVRRDGLAEDPRLDVALP